ncbi:hypothetical protein D3C73_1572720 [compost metagenome]
MKNDDINKDTFVEGKYILYKYCGHDGSSYIKNIDSMEILNQHLLFYSKPSVFYFEGIGIVDGQIIDV